MVTSAFAVSIFDSVVALRKSSDLNNPVSLMWRDFGAEMVLWELQRPGILMHESCKS